MPVSQINGQQPITHQGYDTENSQDTNRSPALDHSKASDVTHSAQALQANQQQQSLPNQFRESLSGVGQSIQYGFQLVADILDRNVDNSLKNNSLSESNRLSENNAALKDMFSDDNMSLNKLMVTHHLIGDDILGVALEKIAHKQYSQENTDFIRQCNQEFVQNPLLEITPENLKLNYHQILRN